LNFYGLFASCRVVDRFVSWGFFALQNLSIPFANLFDHRLGFLQSFFPVGTTLGFQPLTYPFRHPIDLFSTVLARWFLPACPSFYQAFGGLLRSQAGVSNSPYGLSSTTTRFILLTT
jgi:hypothetical protein